MYIEQTKEWLEKFVIGLNLCPFAKPVYIKNQVKFVLSEAKNPDELTKDLLAELMFLTGIEGDDTETTVIVHPFVLQDFGHYLDYLDFANDLLREAKVRGVLQIASFHPDYQFDETEFEDAENFTNRSPFPILHILREDTVEKAIKTYPNVEDIPMNNIEKLQEMGHAEILKILKN